MKLSLISTAMRPRPGWAAIVVVAVDEAAVDVAAAVATTDVAIEDTAVTVVRDTDTLGLCPKSRG